MGRVNADIGCHKRLSTRRANGLQSKVSVGRMWRQLPAFSDRSLLDISEITLVWRSGQDIERPAFDDQQGDTQLPPGQSYRAERDEDSAGVWQGHIDPMNAHLPSQLWNCLY
jgi:hypothetical protein